MSRHVVQTISPEKRPSEMKKIGPFYLSYRQAGFDKRLVHENPNGREHHKHSHEKHEKELTAEGSVSREEFDQP